MTTLPTTIYGVENRLIAGDPLDPGPGDLIAQTGHLPVGEPVPEGWLILSGNDRTSIVARVALRFELEADQ